MEPQYRIKLLGGLRVRQGTRLVTRFRTQKTASLLAYLAFYLDQTHPRELLVELLWPECTLDAGRHSLSMALSALRQQLEPPGVEDGAVLTADRHSLCLNAEFVTTDVSGFEAALAAAEAAPASEERAALLTAAIDLYDGPLLPGHYLDWVFSEQQRLDERYFGALRELILLLGEEPGGSLGAAQALHYALRAVGTDRLREEAHREVMRLYTASGQPDLALRQYRELERLLAQELNVAPAPETRALAEALAAAETSPAAVSHAARAPDLRTSPPALPAGAPQGLPGQSRVGAGFDPAGGAVAVDSQFYVQRPGDEEFRAALARRETIVRIKGPSQVGKTSLLARGLAEARAAGSRVVVTHLRTFNAAHLENADAFLAALAESIAEQLDVETVPRDFWEPHRGANPNFRRYLRRRVLPAFTEHLVWALDEVDQLFERGFGTEIFGLFRSWHDERALEPEGPWSRLTLAMAYSTESHLLIANIHQSPFNVGTCIELEDFPIGQVEELNRRHGRPLAEPPRLIRFYELLGGHPYLVRRGLQELAAHGTSLETFERRAASDDWIFGDHLRRLRAFLARHAGDAGALEQLLRGERSLEEDTFYRLRSAGILGGQTCEDARFRCRLYETYLKRHL